MEFHEDWQARIDATLKANRERERHELEKNYARGNIPGFSGRTLPFSEHAGTSRALFRRVPIAQNRQRKVWLRPA